MFVRRTRLYRVGDRGSTDRRLWCLMEQSVAARHFTIFPARVCRVMRGLCSRAVSVRPSVWCPLRPCIVSL